MVKDRGQILLPKASGEKNNDERQGGNACLGLLLSDWDSWAPLLFLNRERQLATPEEVQACRRIREFYLAIQEDRQLTDQEILASLKDIYSMAFFVQPIIQG